MTEAETIKGLDIATYAATWEEAKSYATQQKTAPSMTDTWYWQVARARFFRLGGECIYKRADFNIELGSVYKVIVSHRNKAREVWVKVLPNDGFIWGYKCIIVGGKTTKLLHYGKIECIKPEQFKKENELKNLRNTVFDF